MKKILLLFLVFLLVIVGFLTYLGVMPFLSPLIVKARDLGVKADPALVTAFDSQNEMKNELPGGVVPSDREPSYEGSKELDVSISSAEITSILEYWRQQYAKTPIRDVQVRINNDGSAEASGILETSTAILMAKQLGYSDQDIEKGKSFVKFIAGDLAFYIKGSGGVVNNHVSINPTEIQIGRVNVPSVIAGQLSEAVANVIERKINQVPGADIEKLTLENDSIRLLGSIPDTIK